MTDSDQGGGSSSSSSSIFPAGDVSAGGSEGNSTSGNMTPLSTPRSSCDPRNCREETGLGGGATAGRSSTSLSPSYLQQRRGSCSKSGAQTREPVAMPLRASAASHPQDRAAVITSSFGRYNSGKCPGHEESDSRDQSHAAADKRRQRPLSAPAKAYSRDHESEFPTYREALHLLDVDVTKKNVETRGTSHQRHAETSPADDWGRNSRKQGREEAKSHNGRTRGGPINVQSGPESRLSATEMTNQDRKSRRTVEELRNWMADDTKPERRLSEESLEERTKVPIRLSPRDFGLRKWKEYAVLRHGGNKRFVNSFHGQEILLQTAAGIRAQEVEELNRELEEMRQLAEELHAALRTQHAEKLKLQSRVVALEREAEGIDFARRRWLKEDASNRGRGSNLERRLAGNTGNLRTFLFGAGAKTDATNWSATVPAAVSAKGMGVSNGCMSPRASRGTPSVAVGSTPTPSCVGEDVDAGEEGAERQREALQRLRERTELEKSELRRRHDAEMSSKVSRIEKLKLEVKKLEAERDGLRRAAETQAELFSGGYAELRACLDDMKSHRQEPSRSRTVRSTAAPFETENAEASSGEQTGLIGTVLAAEEGLNRQVRTLQTLLLEGVSAAVPTVSMPPAVRVAVDSIRTGMGMPPLEWASPAPLARSHDIAGSCDNNTAPQPQSQASSPPREKSGRPPLAPTLRDIEVSASRWQVAADTWGGMRVAEWERSGAAKATGTKYEGRESRDDDLGSAPSMTPRNGGEGGDDDDVGGYAASEGSGMVFPPVMPVDDDSQEDNEQHRAAETGCSLSIGGQTPFPRMHPINTANAFTKEGHQEGSPEPLRDSGGVIAEVVGGGDRRHGLALKEAEAEGGIGANSQIAVTEDGDISRNSRRLSQGQHFVAPATY